MTPVTYHGSRPDPWAVPRWRLDPGERRRIFGPIRPMGYQPGFVRRLIERLTH